MRVKDQDQRLVRLAGTDRVIGGKELFGIESIFCFVFEQDAAAAVREGNVNGDDLISVF